VREGERDLFRLLNASANMGIALALPGHRFTVIALDGNPVPNPASVETLKLDVAERADVTVEMNNPGVWAFAAVDDDDRKMGMGVVVEYANRSREPQWIKPANDWDYAKFARTALAPEPDSTIALKFEKVPGGREASTAGRSTASRGRRPTRCLAFLRVSGPALS
jgi:FtsP/CotA-like multicopper oxidase with cupredoxin domain